MVTSVIVAKLGTVLTTYPVELTAHVCLKKLDKRQDSTLSDPWLTREEGPHERWTPFGFKLVHY